MEEGRKEEGRKVEEWRNNSIKIITTKRSIWTFFSNLHSGWASFFLPDFVHFLILLSYKTLVS